LGLSRVENGAEKKLMRELPAQHPIFDSMYAKEILDIKGVEPDGKEEAISVERFDFAKYKKFSIEVAFTQPQYAIEADDRVHGLPGGEFYRFTTITSKSYVDQIQLELGQMVFDEGPFEGTNLPARPIIRQEKATIRVKTFNVPLELVCYSEGAVLAGTYPRFENAIGKLNETSFLGKERGTMMLDDVDTTDIYADPVESEVTGVLARRVNPEFVFKHFDPPAPDDIDTTGRRGWNRVMGYDRLSYWAVNPDTSEPLFRYYQMNDLLKHWNAL
jgi:hypothetical protein